MLYKNFWEHFTLTNQKKNKFINVLENTSKILFKFFWNNLNGSNAKLIE